MRIRILFISSYYFYQPTVDALARIRPDCETVVVPYTDFSHIPAIYREHQNSCDAVFISGISAKRYLQLHQSGITKPLRAYQVDSDGLHRDILRMAVEYQSLDFSRVAMDFLLPLGTGYSVTDFLAIDDINVLNTQNNNWMEQQRNEPADTEKVILDRIVELWNQGAIDRVICMYSSNIPVLQELGIPYRCPFLSDAHLRRLIRDMLIRIELNHLHNNHPVIIQIFPMHSGSLTEAQNDALVQHVQTYLKANLTESVVQKSAQCCTVVTSLQVLRFLTNDFQVCRLSAYLSKKLDYTFAVAYGIGTTITHAMNNVQIASREAKLLAKPFVMDSNGNLIGPLNSAGNMVITQNYQQEIGTLAQRCNLSAMTIKKIQTIINNNSTDKITIQELASRMGTTIRNANRIMSNLQKGGVATPVYNQVTHSRGRPVQVFALNFASE